MPHTQNTLLTANGGAKLVLLVSAESRLDCTEEPGILGSLFGSTSETVRQSHSTGQSSLAMRHRCELGVPTPNLPFPWGTRAPILYNVTWDHTSAPAK